MENNFDANNWTVDYKEQTPPQTHKQKKDNSNGFSNVFKYIISAVYFVILAMSIFGIVTMYYYDTTPIFAITSILSFASILITLLIKKYQYIITTAIWTVVVFAIVVLFLSGTIWI